MVENFTKKGSWSLTRNFFYVIIKSRKSIYNNNMNILLLQIQRGRRMEQIDKLVLEQYKKEAEENGLTLTEYLLFIIAQRLE